MLKKITQKISNVFGYIHFLILRRVRLKQAKEKDSNIYPLY